MNLLILLLICVMSTSMFGQDTIRGYFFDAVPESIPVFHDDGTIGTMHRYRMMPRMQGYDYQPSRLFFDSTKTSSGSKETTKADSTRPDSVETKGKTLLSSPHTARVHYPGLGRVTIRTVTMKTDNDMSVHGFMFDDPPMGVFDFNSHRYGTSDVKQDSSAADSLRQNVNKHLQEQLQKE